MFSTLSDLQRIFPFMENAETQKPVPYKRSTEYGNRIHIQNMEKPNIMIFDVETTGLLPKMESAYGNRTLNCDEALFTPLKIYNGIQGQQLPINELNGDASLEACPISNLNRRKHEGSARGNKPSTTAGASESERPYPYIIQLSYILYDLQKKEVVKIFNQYVQLPTDFVLSPEITILTGITDAMCKTGIPITDALMEFITDYKTCQTVVSHNIQFDRSVMLIEISRHWAMISATGLVSSIRNLFTKADDINIYCTMQNGKDICNIYKEKQIDLPNGQKKTWSYKKTPKLEELYLALFHKKPENLHNSLIDTLVCMRCYLKMKHYLDIDEENFNNMLKL